MREYFVNYRSITKAQRALRALERQGVAASLQRTPQAARQNGCGYSIRLFEREFLCARPLPPGYDSVLVKTGQLWEAVP